MENLNVVELKQEELSEINGGSFLALVIGIWIGYAIADSIWGE